MRSCLLSIAPEAFLNEDPSLLPEAHLFEPLGA
jgi:hypothetical protein